MTAYDCLMCESLRQRNDSDNNDTKTETRVKNGELSSYQVAVR